MTRSLVLRRRLVTKRFAVTSAHDTAFPAASSVIEIRGVRHAFGDVAVLAGIDISIARHERLGIVGPSGCGKSTLLSAIAGLVEPAEGTITIDQARSADERLARCALMPQRDLLLPWRTALANAATHETDRFGDCLWTNALSRFPYRHNNELSLIRF